MPHESITQEMKTYLDASQTRSIISRAKQRFGIYHASQQVGSVLHRKFGYQKPTFVISGITPRSVEKMGFECVGAPCLLTIMNYRHVIDQLIFGHVLSYRDDHMVADFINLRHLSRIQMEVILTQIHQINRCFLPSVHVFIHGKQAVLTQHLSRESFAKSVIHLLEDQQALQKGNVKLDNGRLYHF